MHPAAHERRAEKTRGPVHGRAVRGGAAAQRRESLTRQAGKSPEAGTGRGPSRRTPTEARESPCCRVFTPGWVVLLERCLSFDVCVLLRVTPAQSSRFMLRLHKNVCCQVLVFC